MSIDRVGQGGLVAELPVQGTATSGESFSAVATSLEHASAGRPGAPLLARATITGHLSAALRHLDDKLVPSMSDFVRSTLEMQIEVDPVVRELMRRAQR